MTWPPASVPLFVYGSLRPGMALWPEVRDDVIDARPATVRGRLWWHVGGEWPLLTIDDADDGWVRGDLLRVRPGEAVNRMIVDEELLFGYDARWVHVTVAADDGDEVVEALVLVWPRADERGSEIAGGDFAAVFPGRRGAQPSDEGADAGAPASVD